MTPKQRYRRNLGIGAIVALLVLIAIFGMTGGLILFGVFIAGAALSIAGETMAAREAVSTKSRLLTRAGNALVIMVLIIVVLNALASHTGPWVIR